MKFVDNAVGRTRSARESATVALNATQETYVYLEAERKGTLGPLLRTAQKNLEKSGLDPQTAFNTVAIRGQYLKEMSVGEKMFYQAASDLSRDSSSDPDSARLVQTGRV